MERIEEFTCEGRNFIYIDFSGCREEKDFVDLTNKIEQVIIKYPKKSLYTITNIADIRFDTRSKDIVAKYMEKNKPYVKCGAVIGVDGIKKMMLNGVFQMSGRDDLFYVFTKEKAIELLLQQENDRD